MAESDPQGLLHEAILEHTPDLVYVVDPERRFTYVNQALLRLLGRTREECIGKGLREVGCEPRLAEEQERAIAQAIAGRQPVRGEAAFMDQALGRRIYDYVLVPVLNAQDEVTAVSAMARDVTERKAAEAEALQRARLTEVLNRLGATVVSELDLETIVQRVTDEATALTGAQFGAFFYNVRGESFKLLALSGAPREAFRDFPQPHQTPLFAGTFRGEGIIRLDDVTADPRYGQMHPHYGMPPGHLPVRSYLAAPVVSRSGDVIGALFLGHEQPAQFTTDHEQVLEGIIQWAAIAFENARLFTASREAEAALRQSEARLAFALEAGQLSSWEVDLAMGTAKRSPRHDQTFGYETLLPEWKHERFLQHIVPEDREWVDETIREAIANGKPWHIECRIQRVDGAIRWIQSNGSPYFDEHGNAVSTIGVMADITERKEMEAALVRRTEEYYRLLENLPAAAYTCDADGLITYFNQRAAEIWGQQPKLRDPEYRFSGALRLFRPDGTPVPSDECWMALAIKTGRAYDGREIIVERPDGSRVTVLAHAHPFHDERGLLIGAVNVLVDVTARKRGEEALARLAAIVASADDAIFSLDLDGVITSWNRGAERLLGYTADEAVGRHLTMVIPADRPDEELTFLARIRQGESVEHYETVRRRKDGSLVDVSMSLSPIVDANGTVVGVSKIARDITERKRQERELAEAQRRKDEFLAMLSHELRNPLAPIRNAVDLLRLDPSDPDTLEEALQTLDHQTNQLTRLVNDLLDVSRVTTGRIQLRRTHVLLNALTQQVANSFGPQMEECRHTFTVTLPGTPLWVYADQTRLEQVLVNLLSNAVKYTPDGGHISLEVALDRQAAQDAPGHAVVRVKDNGIGIEPDLLPHLFELFSQGKRTLDRRQGGLGLGLSLVKNLVEMHGGTVSAASAGPGQGSEFIVRLPLEAGPEAKRQPPTTPTETSGSGGLRVLVVDDNHTVATMMARVLHRKGCHVATAGDGVEALATLDDFRPDVVLLDIGLPGMDGYEVAMRIREQAAHRHVMLVALTGYGQAEDFARSRDAGFDLHIVKPADLASLQRVLDLAAGRRRT